MKYTFIILINHYCNVRVIEFYSVDSMEGSPTRKWTAKIIVDVGTVKGQIGPFLVDKKEQDFTTHEILIFHVITLEKRIEVMEKEIYSLKQKDLGLEEMMQLQKSYHTPINPQGQSEVKHPSGDVQMS